MAEDPGRLTEYNMLQGEINTNSQVTSTVFTVSITGAAALLGYGIESGNWLVLLSPFTILIPSLWFVASQLESTTRIATYVRTFIEPEVSGLDWENRLALLRTVRKSSGKYTVSITGIYGAIGGAAIALAWMFVPLEDATSVISLAVCSVLLLGLTGYIVRECRRCFGHECICGYMDRWEQVRHLESEADKA